MAPPFSFPYKYLLPSPLLLPHHHQKSSLVRAAIASKEPKLPIIGTCRLQVCRRSSQHNSDRGTGRMSRGSRGLDLKLHLSPPPAPARGGGERAASLSSSDEEWSSSSPSSCLSSEGEREPPPRHQGQGHGLQWSDSPEATAMVLAACPRCLMYVMLSEADPRCPRCRSPVLLDFLHHAAGNANGGRDDDRHSRNSTRGGVGRRNRRA